MAKLIWDATSERIYETGVSNGVVYPMVTETTGEVQAGTYVSGYVWNGLTAVTETPSGAEPTPLYADNIKYITLMSAEEFGCTIEAFMYPKEFKLCDGTAEIAPGVSIGQQDRKTFGLVYKTVVGNDVESNNYGYKLHLIYGLLASPSEKAYTTINDSPEAITFSWEATSTPVNVTGFKPTSIITIDSKEVDKEKLAALEEILFGSETSDARLPLPDEIARIMSEGEIAG